MTETTTAPASRDQAAPDAFRATAQRITRSVENVIDGKPDAVRAAVITLLAEGHLLIEDVPGVGKTMLARALAATIAADVRRVQFTPDLLPSDVTGVAVFNQATRAFEFSAGAVFANIVIADEINRSSPKTQSALLEAMEERQVTVDGTTHPLPDPFLVVATQNPLEMEGTYALPEAQQDRFMMRISMGYPDADAEARMLRDRDTDNPLARVRPVVSTRDVGALIRWARSVHVAPTVERYAVALAQATRAHPAVTLGASPRATLQLVRAAKVSAALDGRGFVLPDDLSSLLVPVFAHRIVLTREAARDGAEAAERVLQGIARSVPVPLAG